ncbi:MAG: hypothetical protein ABIP49_06740 [Lysobacterales bacterium]
MGKLKYLRMVVVAMLALGTVVACQKKAAPVATVAPAPTLGVPTDNNTDAWKAYVQQQVNIELKGEYMRGRPYIYFVPSGDDEESTRQYEAQLDSVAGAVARGIQSGSMIVFVSPDSAKLATLVEESFKLAAPRSLKGVRVLFIGAASERDRVTAAVAPSEATFKFIATS